MTKIEELIEKKRKQTKIIHELTFYATMVLTVMFFWALGGKSLLWNIILAVFGAALDLNKKNQLELAAVTREKKERRTRKFVALALSAFTLLSGLGAALNRTLIVTQEEAVAVDTSSVDQEIKEWEKDLALQQEQQLTATRKEWRDDAFAKAENAKGNLKALRASRTEMLKKTVKTEKVTDMFALLARAFGFKDAGTFMVFLLMAAQAAMELSVWVTTTQYWKDEPKKAEEVSKQAEKPVEMPKPPKTTPVVKAEIAPKTQSRPAEAPIRKKSPVSTPRPETPSQKPAIALREMNEDVLKVKTPAQVKKTVTQERFLDLFDGKFD